MKREFTSMTRIFRLFADIFDLNERHLHKKMSPFEKKPYLMKDIIRLQKGLVKTVINVPQNNIEQETSSILELDIKMANIVNEIKEDDKTTIASRHKM